MVFLVFLYKKISHSRPPKLQNQYSTSDRVCIVIILVPCAGKASILSSSNQRGAEGRYQKRVKWVGSRSSPK